MVGFRNVGLEVMTMKDKKAKSASIQAPIQRLFLDSRRAAT